MNEEQALETRRLLSFSDLHAVIWDLYARQTEVRQALVDMNEEFTRLIPKSRLVLYLKRKDSSFEYSALHWGFTIPGLKTSPMGSGGRRVRRIKHVSTPLNDAVIHSGGGDSRRKLFYDFDRRRLSANEAYKKVTKAITTIRQTLKGRAKPTGESGPEAPLPGRPVAGMSSEAQETVRWGWRLLVALLGKEIELLRLIRQVEVSRPDPRIRLLLSSLPPAGGVVRAEWILEDKSLGKLTYTQIRALKIPEAIQRMLSGYERSRRRISKALAGSTKVLEKLMGLPLPALSLAHRGLVEARRKEVDAFGRPIVLEGKAG